jgi:hypothetical protein
MNKRRWETKDSGEVKKFESGATRDLREGKGRFDLISPLAMRRLADVHERGARKYGVRNWEKGIPLSCFIDSAERHINDVKEGKTDEDHMGQALWNLMALIHTEEMIHRGLLPKELDDLVSYMPSEVKK